MASEGIPEHQAFEQETSPVRGGRVHMLEERALVGLGAATQHANTSTLHGRAPRGAEVAKHGWRKA